MSIDQMARENARKQRFEIGQKVGAAAVYAYTGVMIVGGLLIVLAALGG